MNQNASFRTFFLSFTGRRIAVDVFMDLDHLVDLRIHGLELLAYQTSRKASFGIEDMQEKPSNKSNRTKL